MRLFLEFNYKKAVQAINYFAITTGGKIEKLKMIKLVYLADRYHLRKYGKPLTNDRYWAMNYGPVGSSVKDLADLSDFLSTDERDYADSFLLKTEKNIIGSRNTLDSSVLSKSELEALEVIGKNFSDKSASQLVKIAHLYPEWKKFENSLETKTTSREAMDYLDFFLDRSDNVSDLFTLPKDQLDLSKKIFQDNNAISDFIYS